MKLFILLACTALFTIQVSLAEVTISSSGTSDLATDEKEIVAAFTEVLSAFIKSKGNVNELSPILKEMRSRVEKKLKEKGPSYLYTLCNTMSRIYLPKEAIATLVNLMKTSELKQAEANNAVLSRKKRFFKKKGKKSFGGKKGFGGGSKKGKKCGK